MNKDRNARTARTQAAANASLNYAAKVGTAAQTNAAVEASIKNPVRGVPVPAPTMTVIRGDGTVVCVDSRKATYGGELRKF